MLMLVLFLVIQYWRLLSTSLLDSPVLLLVPDIIVASAQGANVVTRK
jgi:hypothetical protein